MMEAASAGGSCPSCGHVACVRKRAEAAMERAVPRAERQALNERMHALQLDLRMIGLGARAVDCEERGDGPGAAAALRELLGLVMAGGLAPATVTAAAWSCIQCGEHALARGDDAAAGGSLRWAYEIRPEVGAIEELFVPFLERSPAFARGWASPPGLPTPPEPPGSRGMLRTARGLEPLPYWDGARPDGCLLLYADSALGDATCFLRWLPLFTGALGPRGARVPVVLVVPAPLIRLARGLPGVREAVGRPRSREPAAADLAPHGPFAAQAFISDAPVRFGLAAARLSGRPYLRPDPSLVERWRPEIERAADGRVTVGLCWAPGAFGNHDDAAARTVGLQALAPLARVPGVALFGIQKTVPEAAPPDRVAPEVEPAPAGLELTRLGPSFEDFSDTAAVMACLDLVISVDSSPAHLAGALGRPVWLVLSRPGDPRWPIGRVGRRRTVWYDRMRIFQQDRPGDWASVVRQLVHELGILVRRRSRAA